MAKMRAVDAAMYVLEKEGITTAFGVPGAAINPSILQCVSMEAFAIYWRVMWKALRIWLRATHVRRQVILGSAWALPARREPT